jgi:uncharacterized membrane protein (DUF106 family)
MLVTPYDLQDKPLEKINQKEYRQEKQTTQYGSKFRSALYAAVLFILLSQKVSYKILDLIMKVFSNRIDIVDEMDNPHFIGTLIMAVVVGIIIFLA